MNLKAHSLSAMAAGGPTTSYGSTTTVGAFAAGTNVFAVSNAVTGLLPGTFYHFTLVATNSAGANTGADLTFTTPAVAPAAVSLSATGVTTGAATLNGTVNPAGGATAYYFQYGADTNYGSATVTNTLPATNFTYAVNNPLTGLLSGTICHFRLLATNTAGTIAGADVTFHTLAATNFVNNTNDAGAGSLREAIGATLRIHRHQRAGRPTALLPPALPVSLTAPAPEH